MASSAELHELIRSGKVACIRGVCDKNHCRHSPYCPWQRTIEEIYRIGRELDELRALPDTKAESGEDGGLK